MAGGNPHVHDAEKANHPLIVEASRKHARPGFKIARQKVHCKDIGKIKKTCLRDFGPENFHIENGHYQVFKEKGKLAAIFFKNGVMVFAREKQVENVKEKKKRTCRNADYVLVEASAPDWTKECSACGVKPIVPETGMCGVCTWGEAECANGNW